MKVGFNARLLTSPTTRGLNRYLVNLLAELGSLGVELYLYSDEQIHPDHIERLHPGSYKTRISGSLRYPVWEQYWFPRQCRADQIDILHSTHNFGLPLFSSCPRVLTLHDAIFHLNNPGPLSRIGDRWRHWAARASAHHIITVSEYSKADLVRRLGIAKDRITVTYESADPRFQEPVSREERERVCADYHLTRPYIFYTGGWESRKNIPFLLRAFVSGALNQTDLVLAGQPAGEVRTMVEKLVAELHLEKHVRLLGWVPDHDLPALYSAALCFVYPSKYEGFGLQLCEAMAVGCPVLAARATSLPEILSSGGETFSLDDRAELIGFLQRVITDSKYRDRLVDRARARSVFMRWRFTAEKTLRVYETLLKNRAKGKVAPNNPSSHCEPSCQ